MILDQLIQAVAIVFGVMLSFAYYPQLWRIWKQKSASEISLPSYLMFASGTTALLLYGLYKQDIVYIVSFVFGAVGSWLIVLLTIYFRRRNKKEITGP